MPEVSVPWGEGELKISLPEAWAVGQVAKSSLRPAPGDWREQLARSLSQPVAGLPLERLLAARRGGRIAVVVEDLTRPSPLPEILPAILREMEHAAVARERIEFVFATGMHPPLSPAQAAAKLGSAAAGFSWRCNPWHDPDAYETVGRCGGVLIQVDRAVAEADLRILVSGVAPHLQAGFGGGYKMLIPGCASLETIRQLHRCGVGRDFPQRVGSDGPSNPMRRVIDEAGSLVDARHGATFCLQTLLDEAGLPSSIAAGDPLPSQQMMAKQCAVACGIVVDSPADVLIVNAHPRDYDLWQCLKCIPNTIWAARRGGAVICLARCPAGTHGMQLPRVPLGASWARRLLKWLGPDVVADLFVRWAPRLAGEAAFFVRLAAHALYRNPIFLVSPALAEAGVRFPGLEIFPTFKRAAKAALAALGEGPQRVVVFPSGGTTYPVPGGPEPRAGGAP
jgi:nickel-dependent lactate racemase